VKVCFAANADRAADLAFERWPTSGLSGQLSQELATPKLFEQAVSVLHKEDVVSDTPLGPDAQTHIDALKAYEDAGYDELYVTQIGPEQEAFLRFYADEVRPAFGDSRARRSA
jgi:hypothetical protein